jgi:hypothetical protein
MLYADLIEIVEDAVENSFTSDVQETIVQNAEYRILDAVDIPAFRTTDSTALTMSSRFHATPADFRAPISFAVIDGSGNYSYLLPKQQDFILEAYPNPTVTGTPVHYALYDDTQFILGPTPSAALTTLLTYSYYPESIVTAGNDNWLGNNFPLVLIKATILEAGIVLKAEEDMMTKYLDEYAQALTLLKNYAAGRLQSDKYRSGEVKTGAM